MNMKWNACVMIVTLIPGINRQTRVLILKYFETHDGVDLDVPWMQRQYKQEMPHSVVVSTVSLLLKTAVFYTFGSKMITEVFLYISFEKIVKIK